MKKLLTAALLMAGSMMASAQIRQGQFMVGGALAFTSSKYENVDGTTTTVLLNPNAGYFFINNLAGGLRATFGSLKESDNGDAYTTIIASPFLRYYVLPTAQKVNLFVDASYGIGSQGAGDKKEVNQYAFTAGPAIFITPNTALEFGVSYSSQGGDAIGDNRLNTIGVSVGFQIHLGKGKTAVTH